MPSTVPNGRDVSPDSSIADKPSRAPSTASSRRALLVTAIGLLAPTALVAPIACSSWDEQGPKPYSGYDSSTGYNTGDSGYTGYNGIDSSGTGTGASIDDYIRGMCEFFDRCDKFETLIYGRNV